jgi:CRP-like cAMP-binding protein
MDCMSLTTQILPPSGPIESLTEGDRALLSSAGSFASAKAGEKLIHQGKPHGRLIFTLSGLLHAKREDDGHTEILGSVTAGQWLGEINLFDPSTAVCSVEAVEPSEYWVITRDAFEKFINKNHSAGSVLLIGLAMTLSKRIRELTEKRAVPAKSKSKPFLWTGLAFMTVLAIAATWNWIGGTNRISRLGVQKQQRIAEVEQAWEASKVKTKELEIEVTRLQEELEWSKAEAEKKNAVPLATPAPKENIPAATTPDPQPVAENSALSAKTDQEKSQPSQQPQSESPDPKPKSPLVAYPPEITLTKDTMVPLTVGGKVSGSAKISASKTFKVVGSDDATVLVTMGASTVRIPKENTNFEEALDAAIALAEEKAKAAKSAVPLAPLARKPSPTPVAATAPEPGSRQGGVHAASTDSPAIQIEKMVNLVAPLKALDALHDFRKSGKESARSAFMRTEARKWEQAAETAKNCLRTQEPDESAKRLLKNIVLTAEMFATERFDGIEGKLHEIDAGWLAIKTDLEIYGPEGHPKQAAPQE